MFEQLRTKVALRQSLTLCLMLVVILSTIFGYNALQIATDINNNLTEMVDKSPMKYFDGNAEQRDKLVIWLNKDGKMYLSDKTFYDGDTLDKLVDGALAQSAADGRIKINGRFIAYAVEKDFLGIFIYVYDYTGLYRNLNRMFIMLLVTGIIGIVAIILFSVQFASKSVAPIEDAFNKQQDLIANASHELKTPITIINTDLAVLNTMRDNLTDEQKKWLDSINNQLSRMSALINDMLELARVESNGDKKPFETVNLSTVTESVVLGAEALAFERNITFDTDIAKDIGVQGNALNLEKLIYILIENALKYTDENGRVSVSVTAERKKAILKVRNTGEGIARENLPKLFDRFYRTDEAHTASGSFGLGLAIAKSIVDAHGGTIGVDSKVGEYTEFIVILRQ